MKKRFIAIILGLIVAVTLLSAPALAENKDRDIVILYESDVHCAVEGYSKLLAMKNELLEEHSYVAVVSSGDFVQGGTLGAVSLGEYIIRLMNIVGYDAICLGNHEFDYSIPRLIELQAMSDTAFLSCNFEKLGEGRPYFEPYTIVSYGDVDIAYIGITTPETIVNTAPLQFMNEKGEFIYSFNVESLSESVQAGIDAAEAAGADYVIALSHMGYREAGDLYDITDVIENTEGLDVVLDGHAHVVIEGMPVKDKGGNEVLLSSVGTRFEHIGKLTITDEGIETELIPTASYTKTDPELDACLEEIEASYAELGERKIGTSSVELITNDKDGNRLVRKSETNLGNFCADALRIVPDADVSYSNGGGMRAPMAAGDVTFNDIFSVFPFNNQVVTGEVTGQVLLDLLEMAVMTYPEENGSFPHVSGITFSVNTAVPSSVQLDKNGMFREVDGEYRVYNVKVLDRESGTYLPLAPEKNYVLAAYDYFLLEYGSGMYMLKDAKILDDEGMLDVELLEQYILYYLDGAIDERYAELDPRISFTEGYTDK